MNYLEIKAYLAYIIANRWISTKRFFKKLPETVKYFFVHTLFRTATYKWDKKLAGLLANVPEKNRPLYTAIFKNLRNVEEVERQHGPNKQPIIDMFSIVKRVLDNLTVTEIIDVQPMTGPVGTMYHLQWTEEEPDDDGSKRAILSIESKTIEASSKFLKTTMSMEAVDDFSSLHGIDIRSEMVQAVASEIATEINTDHINSLKHIAKEFVERRKPETAEDLIMSIQAACGDIAADTRRGMGNFAVMSQVNWNKIDEYGRDPKSSLSVEFEGGTVGPRSMILTGTLLGSIKVYCDIDADENILVGYKGASSEIDSGYTWCPYNLIVPCGVVVDKETFQPIFTMLTRSAVSFADNASSYYRIVKT